MQTSNLVYSHPTQKEMQVEVILASQTDTGSPPLYTIRMRYPRPIHGEIMTHRVFSRNARSSRAVPVKTMLNEVRNTPFVPWHWGKNQKGMQADEECTELVEIPYRKPDDTVSHHISYLRHEAWLHADQTACDVAEAYMLEGYHKQIPNRLLEPFSWIDTLITTSDWSNFLWLRQHRAAEPHLQDLANLVALAIEHADIQNLPKCDWHLPYITREDWNAVDPMEGSNLPLLLQISAARCARISYRPFNGDSSLESELKRYDLLVSDERVHASPLEHQAMPDSVIDGKWMNPNLHGNFTGWIQHRKLVPNEVYRG